MSKPKKPIKPSVVKRWCPKHRSPRDVQDVMATNAGECSQFGCDQPSVIATRMQRSIG